jgi:hypothetical protein
MEVIDLRLATQRFHLELALSVVTGSRRCRARLPSVLPLAGVHRYESLLPIRSLEWRAQLRTLGGDKPVIPGVAFIR